MESIDNTAVYPGIVRRWPSRRRSLEDLSVENSAGCPLTLAMGSTPAPRRHPIPSPSIPTSASATRRTGSSLQRDLPRLAATHRDLSRHQGNARCAGVSAQHLSGRRHQSVPFLSRRIHRISLPAATCRAKPVSVQLRRRLHSGFAASLQYTWSKSIDDDSLLGGQGPPPRSRCAPEFVSARAARRSAPRASRRTGAIYPPNAASPPSTSATC